MLTPALRSKIQERFDAARKFTTAVRQNQRDVLLKSEQWNSSPLHPARVAYEVSRAVDRDAYVVIESAERFGFEFDPLNGPHYIASRAGFLGFAVGGAAGVKLAKPDRQVVCMVGDGSFLFGPHALWTMARLEIPVIVVVFNNHSYNGVKDRSLAEAPRGRMSQTGHLVHYYIGDPEVDMARLAEGFGVKGEKVAAPSELQSALRRALAATKDGKPYLIDAQIARSGMLADSPWYPKLSVANQRKRPV